MRAWDSFESVFIGGGTPSLLDADDVLRLLLFLSEQFIIQSGAEISLECNPESLDREKPIQYKSAGINRLSIGVQSMDDDVLAAIGRIHNSRDVAEVILAAREAGFTNINADLIHGLPCQDELSYLNSLYDLDALGPVHISSYRLTVTEGTKLDGQIKSSLVTLPGDADVCAMQDVGIAFLQASGYQRYEISNFAKPGYECRHNINYWENGEYLGLGAGAHSAFYLNGKWTRRSNTPSVEDYIKSRFANPSTLEIGAREEEFESVMLGLRMIRGISLSAYKKRFGKCFTQSFPEAVQKLTRQGYLIIDDGHARLNQRGLDIQNEILVGFLDY